MPTDESQLRAFFREELGGELPPLPFPHHSTPRARLFKPNASRALLVLAGVAALTIVSVALFGPQNAEENTPAREVGAEDGRWTSELVLIEDTGVVTRVSYETNEGPVEQVTNQDWITVAQIEPRSGDRVIWSAEELTIEVRSLKNKRKR